VIVLLFKGHNFC